MKPQHDPTAGFIDLKSHIAISPDPTTWVRDVSIAIGVLALTAIVVRLLRRMNARTNAVLETPLEAAERGIHVVSERLSQGSITSREAASLFSQAVRRYISQRLSLPAEQLSLAELRRRIEHAHHIPASLRTSLLADILATIDALSYETFSPEVEGSAKLVALRERALELLRNFDRAWLTRSVIAHEVQR